jgi:hypothetical protein
MGSVVVAMHRHVNTAACEWWCMALVQLLSCDASKALMRVAAVRNAHAALHRVAAPRADVKRLWDVVGYLMENDLPR